MEGNCFQRPLKFRTLQKLQENSKFHPSIIFRLSSLQSQGLEPIPASLEIEVGQDVSPPPVAPLPVTFKKQKSTQSAFIQWNLQIDDICFINRNRLLSHKLPFQVKTTGISIGSAITGLVFAVRSIPKFAVFTALVLPGVRRAEPWGCSAVQ